MMLDAHPEGFARSALRARTASSHESIDAAFGRFSLSEPASYRLFLLAHARVLPALEARLSACSALPAWRPRRALLEADLAALGEPAMPVPLDGAEGTPLSEPALHGVLYVLEGSRLGGKMLARGVGEGLPRLFLADGHEKGEWRSFLAELDERAARGPSGWLDEAVEGALFAFGLYGRTAATPL